MNDTPSNEVEEFIRHWELVFGERLTEHQAREEIDRLAELYQALARGKVGDREDASDEQ